MMQLYFLYMLDNVSTTFSFPLHLIDNLNNYNARKKHASACFASFTTSSGFAVLDRRKNTLPMQLKVEAEYEFISPFEALRCNFRI